MRLFHAWLSSASRRVRLCLAEKNIPYDSVAVDLSRQEQHAPEFLAMNPDGVVPALEISPGRFLHESSTLCEYLDDIAPEPPLRPADPYALAQMRNFVRWTDEKSLPHLLILNWSLMLQSTAQQWSDQELQDKLARIPTAERREAWVRIARKPYTEEEKAEALRKLLLLVDRMEGMLAPSSPWLMGANYSLADIAAAPFIARIAEIEPAALAEATHPRVHRWWQAMQQRPAFAAARLQLFGEVLQERQRATTPSR
ncbi:glutathione S-transferase family protein [Acidovorax sp.]|uniref:glutathione S-transferase family protein n=1 Tax=Acidovorax sp. TaxID=1872122 RepID=UPI002ACE2CDC|nr:glutathione S-transferase family protein [Acidovorax sp.]MDZ7866760.1 glutathione S-transferase family protein [Acidovorax sp.]